MLEFVFNYTFNSLVLKLAPSPSQRPTRQHSTLQRQRSGMTLVESLVSAAILLIVMASVMPAFISNLQINTDSEVRADAVVASRFVLERYRAANTRDIPNTGSEESTVTIRERDYTVTSYFCERNEFCTDESRHIRLEVAHGGEIEYETETVYTRIR
jgi:prepilin-type N-terminal cleavage/methylation domain-containing protein